MLPALRVNDLRTYYFIRKTVIKAVDGVTFDLEHKQALGLIGESGCGKSTIAMSIMRLIAPPGKMVGGEILLHGEDLMKKSESEMRKVRWRKISVVFQEAMNEFNPIMKMGDQIVEGLTSGGRLTKSEAVTEAKKLFELVSLDTSRIDNYPHEFSGGMKQRAAIAMALSCDPEIIICDEPTTALDVIVQAHILDVLTHLRNELGLSMILVTHDVSVVAQVCDKVAVTYAGKIVELADVKELFKNPMHPYSQALLRSFPSVKGAKSRLESIPGFPPDLASPPAGCAFNPRCIHAMEICTRKEPRMREDKKGHYVACFRYDDT
jgi:peptide/nickel transport system ATP-binding protein